MTGEKSPSHSLTLKSPGLTTKQTLVCSVVFFASGYTATKELSRLS